MNEEASMFNVEESCEHMYMERVDNPPRGVEIQKCKDCGYESWHHEDSHG